MKTQNRIIVALLVAFLASCGIAAATDTFGKYTETLSSPYRHAFNIAPHDTNTLAYITRAVYVGQTGNVYAVLAGDSTGVTFYNVATGFLEIRAKIIGYTYTTASYFVGLY